MKWSMLWDLSVHNMSVPFDHTCCLDKSESETCLHFPVSEHRCRRLQSESFFLFPLLFFQQFNSMLSTNTSTFNTSSTPTPTYNMCPESSCSCFSQLVGFLGFNSDSGNFWFQGFLIFFVSHFSICTRLRYWFDVITNWCYISIQRYRWTYERTALSTPFLPDC